jgi:hypothetical protein
VKRITRNRPSPSMVIAVIALIAGLSGSAIAKPVANLIGGKQIKKNAVTSRHVKNGSLRMSDLNAGVRNTLRSHSSSDGQRGPQGPKGSKGDRGPRGLQGPPGPAGRDGKSSDGGSSPSSDLLFAKVNQNGSLASRRGAIGASVSANGTTKTVTFNRDVSRCVPAVSAEPGAGGILNGVNVSVNLNLVTVNTAEKQGAIFLLLAC